ncbi:MAG TPA: PilN domain-containing protein [Thermodesulfovibrionales bacterium]|nr:PilN domain-containing protein [Thermodesulfovibrionales bacterium]
MIRINLLSVKRKKKAKPLPTFIVSIVLITLAAIIAVAYLFYYYNSNLQTTKDRFNANKEKIAELKNRIKEVENFEKLNATIEERTKIIELLRKRQNVPVMILDEVSKNLPKGVWLRSMTVSGNNGFIEGSGFTNSDVVAYVDNLKSSKLLSDIYLQESRQAEVEKIPLYQFKLTFRVAV